MSGKELFQFGDYRSLPGSHGVDHLLAQRVVVGRLEFGIVSGRVDSGHHGEKTGTHVQLAMLGCRARRARHKQPQYDRDEESTQTLLP